MVTQKITVIFDKSKGLLICTKAQVQSYVGYMIHIFDLCQSTCLQIYTFGALRDKKYVLPKCGQIDHEVVLFILPLESDKPSSILCKYASHKITKFDSSNTMIKTWIIIQQLKFHFLLQDSFLQVKFTICSLIYYV